MVVLVSSLAATAVGAPGSSARPAGTAPSGSVHPVVRPATGTPRTHFVVRFRAGAGSSSSSSLERHYSVTATGPRGQSCSSRASATVITSQAGRLERVTLSPARHRWCRGKFHGKITLFETPICPRPTGVMACPLFVIDRGVVGRFTFRVR
jgi:hypothetical protein